MTKYLQRYNIVLFMDKVLNKKVFVAMSGGVDSSVAAALLKNEGYDVTGVHMFCWEGCENNEDKQDALCVAAVLDIPFLVWDFKKEYREAVFNYMIREYAAGRTPNPDVMCNKEIKFGVFLKRALEAGADFIATGHYVRRDKTARLPRVLTLSAGAPTPTRHSRGFISLFSARDTSKDQSYFLWTLTQDQLKHSIFPIGDYLKSEVRELAKKFNLPTAEKKDSQGLCFVGNIDFEEFIKNYLPKKIGQVVDSFGKTLGSHDGAHFYTIGQRRGLNLGGQPRPIYVAQKNAETNILVMANGQADPILYRSELIFSNANWTAGEPSRFPAKVSARVRYRQPLQRATIFESGRVIFDTPQRAVAIGQSVVFYLPAEVSAKEDDGDKMLGGGVIRT